MKPIAAASPIARRSTCRGSAQDGEPSGMVMSQNIRAEYTRPPSASQGSTWKVDGSGRATMSDSKTLAKPSMAEPSNPMPSLNAPSSSAGCHRDGLEEPEDVGEPQPDEPDVAFLEGAEDELLLTIHEHTLCRSCFAGIAAPVMRLARP